MDLVKDRIHNALDLWPSILRAFKLVWHAAPRWTSVWLILLIIQGLLPVATVYLTKYLVNSLVALIDGGLTPELLRPTLIAMAGMILVMLISEVLRSFTNMVYTAQSELINDHVRKLVQDKAVLVDAAYYDSPIYYDRLHRASYESHYRPTSLVRNFGSLLQNTITLVAMAGVLLQYGLILPVALFASSLPALYIVLHHRKISYVWRIQNTASVRHAWYFDWLLTSRRTASELRLFDLGDQFREAYWVIRTKLRQERLDLARKEGFSELVAGVFSLVVLGITLAWMVWQAIQGIVTLGDLALFYQAFNIGQGLVRSLLNNMGEIYADSLFLTDLFEYLDLKSFVTDPENPKQAPTQIKKGISFEDVVFHYPDSERPLLNNFNLNIGAGQFVAIVGKNGAGKSTLVKLLTRLYDVNDGQIAFDGIDIRQMRLADLRKLITVLFQDPVNYNDTVAKNIAIGDLENADRKEIVEAAHKAGANSIIEGLPQDYETLLGKRFEGGTDLSIGEWQRLALARAFLRKAPIVILDEPTSAMDPWAEAEWMFRFRQSMAENTIFLITHRLSTAMFADKIFLMENGRIIESGNHNELLALDGLYADSWYASGRQDIQKSEEETNLAT
jgi:ATP-binding cassette subfamily B protein